MIAFGVGMLRKFVTAGRAERWCWTTFRLATLTPTADQIYGDDGYGNDRIGDDSIYGEAGNDHIRGVDARWRWFDTCLGRKRQ